MLDPLTAHCLVLFGGSFDPPHRAHVTLPFDVAHHLGADGVLFIPAGQPPHKSRQLAPATDRLAMLKLALGDRDDAAIWTGELERSGPSYTARTLEILRAELGPKVDLRLLMGADMAEIFYQWREPEAILALADPVVMMRPPVEPTELLNRLPTDLPESERQRWRERIVSAPLIDVDSTRLRELLAKQRYDDPWVVRMVPEPVLSYIRERRLYTETLPHTP